MPLKPTPRLLACCAFFISMAAISHAQLLSVNTMTPGYNAFAGYTAGAQLNDGSSVTQSFLGITSIDTVTYRFIATTPGAGTTLDVYFTEWAGLGGANALTSLGVGTFSLPVTPTWTNEGGFYYYDMAFDLTSVAGSLNALNTYGLTVVGNADSAAGGYRIGGADIAYGGGDGFTHTGVSAFGDLTSGGSAFGNDVAFIANSAPGYDAFTVTPVPEASTVAVLLAGLFVGGMAFYRVRQRRQSPVSAVEA